MNLNDTQLSELESFHNWLTDACSKGAVPVVTGKNGDMDTIGSAVALSAVHSNMMACGLHLGRVAKKVCEELTAPFRRIGANHSNWPASLSGLIIVDAASPSQVGIDIPKNVPKIPRLFRISLYFFDCSRIPIYKILA